MSQTRKLVNVRLNGELSSWRLMASKYNLHHKMLYNRAQKSNKTKMVLEGDVIQWDVIIADNYFVVEGKRLDTVKELADYVKVNKFTMSKVLQRNGNSFTYNKYAIRRMKIVKKTLTETGTIHAVLAQSHERRTIKYDTYELGGQTLVRKFYTGGKVPVLMHTYGYEQGKKFLTV
jgi:hypothetical protein